MIGTHGALGGLSREQCAFPIRAVRSAKHPGCSTDIQIDSPFQGLLEPVGRSRQKVQQVEKDRTGGLRAGHPGDAVTVGIAAPDAYGVVRRDSDCPCIPISITGSRLPGRFPDGGNEFPVDLVGTVHFLERLESVPESYLVFKGRGGVNALVTAYHPGICCSDVTQRPFATAQNERESIVRGVAVKCREAGFAKEFQEARSAIRAQHMYRGNVQRTCERLRCGNGPVELEVEILGCE